MSEEQDEAAEDAVEAEAETDGKEQRCSIRFRTSMGVHVRLSSGTVVRTQGKNISIGGIYVEFEAPADMGDEFEMMFDVIFTDEIKRIFVKAKVTRCALIGGKDIYGIAFQFLSFAKDTEKVLGEYLDFREQQQLNSPI